ncbi:MAG: TerC family protein [Pirellulales bacterium]|nr:TerC family protein [Pirellulales bacterium]
MLELLVQREVLEWIVFSGLVLVLLTLDLLVFHRHDHTPTLKESAGWSLFWISIALGFNGLLWWWLGGKPSLDFFTGYLVEKSLSVDNVFVFAVIFRFFHVPIQYQYRVLFWGVLGAIFLRLAFVLIGAGLLSNFHWVLMIFGFFLIYTAYKLARHANAEVHPDRNIVLRTARRWLPVTRGDHHQYGHAFFAREGGRLCITPMFLVLLVVESTDVVFAMDSVPAILAITRDVFIVFSSNVFAILGLRALYFLFAGAITMFRYLHYGLSAILAFIGAAMIAEYFYPKEVEHYLPTPVKLGIIAGILTISILASVLNKEPESKTPGGTDGGP